MVEDAILGLCTKSANDAAVAVGEFLGGNEPAFADMMTRKAREIGMRETVFRNASGLPNLSQFSSARDMATLARALLHNHSRQYHYFSTQQFTYNGETMRNHNHLMEWYDGVDGIKTGYIGASGFNLVASVKRDNRRLIGVVFGGQSAAARDRHMAQLLDTAFSRAPGSTGIELANLPEQTDEDTTPAAPKGKNKSQDQADYRAVMKAMASAQAGQVASPRSQPSRRGPRRRPKRKRMLRATPTKTIGESRSGPMLSRPRPSRPPSKLSRNLASWFPTAKSASRMARPATPPSGPV